MTLCTASIGHVYRILYEEVNESDVTVLNIVSPSCKGVEVEEHRYPRPGKKSKYPPLGK